jgi:hypothetical protein
VTDKSQPKDTRFDERTFVDRKLVYVAGPYTRPDPVHNTHRVINAVDEMIDEGLVTPFAPHLTLLWHLVKPRELDFWYAYDLATLARCDALFRLDGESTGADREVAFAERSRIPVFHSKIELYDWASR